MGGIVFYVARELVGKSLAVASACIHDSTAYTGSQQHGYPDFQAAKNTDGMGAERNRTK